VLTGISVVLIGGDPRQLEVIRKLADLDASVTLIGFDHLQHQWSGVRRMELSAEALENADAVILPVVGCDEQGRVDSVFSSGDLILTEELLDDLPRSARIYTGMSSRWLRDVCAKLRIELVEFLKMDEVAIYNSIPTAEGALMLGIQHTDITIHGSRCMVLGFGRTGMTMARVLKGMGASVKVGVRRRDHFARAWEMGFQPFNMSELPQQVQDVDLVYNTVPAPVLSAQVLSHMPHTAVVIDLASKPGGTDFRYAEKRGIKAILAPSLPGLVAPKTAGRIIAGCLAQLIKEHAVRTAPEGEG